MKGRYRVCNSGGKPIHERFIRSARYDIKWVRLLLQLFIVLTCAITGIRTCRAETTYVDASKDAVAYRQAVAEMNTRITVSPKKVRRAVSGATVLCRTDGKKLDPSLLETICCAPEQLYAGPDGRYTMRFSSLEDAQEMISRLEQQPWICYAELDQTICAAQTTFKSWGSTAMDLEGYLSFSKGWGTGQSRIAVIDSGVWPHEMLIGKLINGGYDYVDNDEDPSNDEFGHGTRVAGIVADCTRGAPVTIYPIRVLDAEGNGLISNVVNAIDEACDAGVNVINLSMAVRGKFVALEDMVQEAVGRGVVVVVAAGNFSCDTSKISPANLCDAGVIVVSSAEISGTTDILADYSCYGDSVDVCTYGSDILCCDTSGGYSTYSGTSMAAPHVSAVCALMHLLQPDLSPAEMEERLKVAVSNSAGLAIKLTPLVPADECFRMNHIRLAVGETLPLPTEALPLTCGENIRWSISGTCLQLTDGGALKAVSPGEGVLSAECRGFEDCDVRVEVVEEETSILRIPNGVRFIEAEAFFGSDVSCLELPKNVQRVEEGAFLECSNLRMIKIEGPNTVIGLNAFDNSEWILLCFRQDSSEYLDESHISGQYLYYR